MMQGIGASILSAVSCCNEIKIMRSKFLAPDTKDGPPSENRFEVTQQGSIRHLGMVEINEITGKRVRDTIRARSTEKLFAAVTQENAEEDLIHYDGSQWRVINVRKNKSTWVATAVRTAGKEEFCINDTNTISEPSSLRFI